MIDKLRYNPRYRDIVNRHMPSYTIEEVHPGLELVPKEMIKDDNVVIFDVGANHGIWSASAILHSGQYIKQIHLFEALAGNVARIMAHREAGLYEPYANKMVVNNKAVSDTPGTITINTNADSSGYASAAVSKTLFGWKSVDLDKQVEVESVTLDGYAEAKKIDIVHFLKVDVEGHELPVFKGSKRLLSEKRILSIAFEFGTHQMGPKHYFRDFFEYFSDLGYDLFKARPHGWAPSKIARYDTANEDFSQVRTIFAAPTPA